MLQVLLQGNVWCSMELKELYYEYGKLMIQIEALQGRMIDIKKQIVEQINAKRVDSSEK